MKRLAVLVALVTGCVPTSQIGPYVKNVTRNGAWLAVQKCMIVLEGETLSEAECRVEHVPLGSIPMAPAPYPQPMPMGQPGPQPAPQPAPAPAPAPQPRPPGR